MKKFLPSFFLFLFTSLFLAESSIAGPLRCKTHSSRACKDKGNFVREQNDGCARPSGNCRWYFCTANCVNLSGNETLLLCKKNCFNPPLLARFDSKTREALYANFYPKGKGKRARKHSRDAYYAEKGVQDAKSKRWWKFWGKSKKSELLDRLEKEYKAQIARKTKRLKAAKAHGDTRKAKKIEKEIVTLVVEASSSAVPGPDARQSKAASVIQKHWRKHQEAKKHGKAATALQKYWRGRQGRQEAKRIKEQRVSEAASLIEALPQSIQSSILASVKRKSGVYKTDASGKRYFVPAPPPPPKSEKVKRISRELTASRRSSTASDFNVDDLPPPPASMIDAGSPKFNIPPPPPMPPAVSTSVVIPSPHTPSRVGLFADIQKGKSLKRTSTHKRSSSSDARGGLLDEIAAGKNLKHVEQTQPKKKGAQSDLHAALMNKFKDTRSTPTDQTDNSDWN
jgi:hypothetical protein